MVPSLATHISPDSPLRALNSRLFCPATAGTNPGPAAAGNGAALNFLLPIPDHPDLPPCAGCGRCCHLVVELRAGDVVAEHLVVEHDGVRCMDQRGNGACVALDAATMLCTIYETRPQTCRDFTRGESICRRILGRPAG